MIILATGYYQATTPENWFASRKSMGCRATAVFFIYVYSDVVISEVLISEEEFFGNINIKRNGIFWILRKK